MDDLLSAIKKSPQGSFRLSQALKAYRLTLELSVQDVAENIFLPVQTIIDIEENDYWDRTQATYICLYYHAQVLDILYLCLKRLDLNFEQDI